MNDTGLTAEGLNKYLKYGCTAVVYDEVDSTNLIVKQLARQGAPEGTVVAAERQTAGRGRLGRNFFSPEGGLYLSLLLRPTLSPEKVLLLTAAAAVAVSGVLECASGKKCLIKWVNDIYINSKKVCGILTEGTFGSNSDCLDSAVVGIGINLTLPKEGYPAEISDRADAVFGTRKLSTEEKSRLAADIVNALMRLYNSIADKPFMDEYRRRSYLNGLEVEFELNGESHTATVLEIDENARLVVEENGRKYRLGAGDVSVKPISGNKNE